MSPKQDMRDSRLIIEPIVALQRAHNQLETSYRDRNGMLSKLYNIAALALGQIQEAHPLEEAVRIANEAVARLDKEDED